MLSLLFYSKFADRTQMEADTGKYPIYMNLFVCTFNFVLGMYMMQILEKSNKIVTILSIFVIMAFVVKLGTGYVNEISLCFRTNVI